MKTAIETKYGVITIEEDESGRGIVINIDSSSFKGQLKFSNFTVNCSNAGSPGIIGPDVDFNVGDVIDGIIAEASKNATDFPT
jgi:hypothetical protein